MKKLIGDNRKSSVPTLFFSWSLALVPFLHLLFTLSKYKINIPFWDQWEFILFLEKYYEGKLSLSDFWIQHNEHRILFPKIIMLILANISGWNITYELIVNILLATGTFFVLVYYMKNTLITISKEKVYFYLPLTSLMVFSLNQSENWFWGWQITFFLNVFSTVLGLMFLLNPPYTKGRYFLALISGVVATYSLANGLLFWPIGLFILLFTFAKVNKFNRNRITLWIIFSSLTIFLYLYGYHKPAHHPPLTIFIDKPLNYIAYVLANIGAPLATFNTLDAIIIAVVGLSVFIVTVITIIRLSILKFQHLIPFVALSLYSILSSVIIGIGRGAYGRVHALSFRYITISSLFWISNLFLLFILIVGSGRSKNYKLIGIIKLISASFIVLFVFQILLTSAHGTWTARDQYSKLFVAKNALLSNEHDELLKNLYPPVNIIKERVEILKRYNLSAFRD